MYRCELCTAVVPARQRANKIVLATRPKTYDARGTQERERERRFIRRGMPRKLPEYDKGGVGTEIVKEATVCAKCAAEHNSLALPAADASTAAYPAV